MTYPGTHRPECCINCGFGPLPDRFSSSYCDECAKRPNETLHEWAHRLNEIRLGLKPATA